MKLGKVDFKDFQKLQKRIEQAGNQPQIVDEFMVELLFELAGRAEAYVKIATPVDTGHLRRNWFVSDVEKVGEYVRIQLYNNVEYASFKEHGHRTRGHKSWVDGHFMLKIAMAKVEAAQSKIINRHHKVFLKELMNI